MKSIKDIKAIRVILKPYIDWKKRRNHERYLATPDHFYLRTLKGIHEGKRCFIIGNGPSLRFSDLDKLQGEYTFASNRIFKIFDQTKWRPSYYLSVDEKVMRDIQDELLNYDLGHIFLSWEYCKLDMPTSKLTKINLATLTFDVNYHFYNVETLYVSEDVSDHFCDGKTVTYEAIQLAIYMGFKEIYLLGVDQTASRKLDALGRVHVDLTVQDYFDGKKYSTNPSAHLTNIYAYTIAKEYCDTHRIKIFNATRGGKLEVFERVDFDELMKGN